VVIAGFQGYLLVQLLRFVDTHATPGGFGTPLHYLMDVREAVLDQHPDSVIVVSEEELAPFEEIPAVWSVLLEPVPDVRFVNGTRTAVSPADAALELIAWSPALRTCPDQACADQDGARVFEQRPGEPPYLLLPAGTPMWADRIWFIEPVRFTNGAILTGYAVKDDGVVVSWELSDPPEPAWDYQAFVHALDTDGNKLAQADRPGWPGRYWRAGDQLVLWFDLTLPLGTRALAAGMYRIEGSAYISAEVIDEQGAYIAQAATIPLD